MNATKINPFNPDYAVPPGAVLEEWIDERGMTQTQLAERMGRPIKTINEIIQGKARIVQETALQLESVTGIEASFWTNAERLYCERAARVEEQAQFVAWGEWAKAFPYMQMVKHGWVPAVKSISERVQSLLRFFSVASPDAWTTVYADFQVAYRKSPKFKGDSAHLGAWLRRGEVTATGMECGSYSEEGFKAALTKVRGVTSDDPSQAAKQAVNWCKETGVAVVFVPELSKTHVSGATRWLNPNKAVVQLSLRHKTDDHLWFSFFHEAAHILLHGKKGIIIEFPGKEDDREVQANQWASQFLIPRNDWDAFLKQGMVTDESITRLAKKVGVSPGVIVGRLQHDGIIPHATFNHLKRRLQLVRSAGSDGEKS